MMYSSTRGFTLLEMIVSVGLFSIVMTITISAYLGLISLDRRARATNQVVNNLSFAVDAMTRGIRTGTGYHCIDGTPDAYGNNQNPYGCTQFYYTDPGLQAPNNVVTYYKKANGTIGRCESSAACTTDANSASITDPAITIQSIAFFVRGAGTSDNLQPQVLFTITGTMPMDNKGGVSSFSLEESATQRLIDL